jgi:hypothetical protein
MRWVVWEGQEPPPAVMETVLAFIRAALLPGEARRPARKRRT